MAPTLPHSPLHPNLLHPHPHSYHPYPDPLPWSLWWCGGEGYPQCAHFLTLKKRITWRQVSEKFFSKRWTSLFHGFARLFGKWKFVKKSDNFLIGICFNWQWYSYGRVGYYLGSMVVWVLSWEVRCNGRRMALKLVGRIILVSMVTNHPYQTHPITIKPPPLCRVSCEEHRGWCSCWEGCISDCLKRWKKRRKKKERKKECDFFFPFHLNFVIQIIQCHDPWCIIFTQRQARHFFFFFFFFFF